MASQIASQILKNKLVIRIIFKLDRMRHKGVLHNLQSLIRKTSIFLLAILLMPVSLLLLIFNIKRLVVFTDRIGHFAAEPDTIIKEQLLGRIATRKWLILAPKNRVSNQWLLEYWKQYFTIVQSSWQCFFLEAITYWFYVRCNASYAVNRLNGAQEAYAVNAAWGDRPPLFKLTNDDEEYAADMLQKLGIPKGVWFVCIHAREGGYSTIDESIHWHRNGDIQHLTPSINEIIKRGGWVVRLGDPTTKPMPEMEGVIDYAHHSLRSERMDIILCARARFILGNTSGIFLVGYLFGTPSALVNMIPLPTLGIYPRDISIPKLYRDPKTNRYLTFNEIMDSEISLYRYASLYKRSGLILEENTPEEILDVTTEMLDRLDNNFSVTELDELNHQRYMSLFKPRHYSYGAASRVSIKFLRRHQDLLRADN